ncbi:LacI family DNA-binding transcriptional regulator [Paenibacillus hamazuiensis]|uniref:LacI family DNA-binding transcriptional regulator n=1 Tax=Paenibacillus hamazuiensis TaxID=2936508 RepID=UPI00200EDB65|nr:LacI family DNA-binding transcriptional regulator [Paenibacillus hamazuiensis]
MTKRVTSFDVAKRAGVSRSIVSAVLNGTPGIGVSEEKRRAVLQAIEELNYKVDAQAKAMRTGRSGCIGAYGDLSNPLFAQMLEGLQEACEEAGYHVLLCGVKDRSKLIGLYMQRRIDGIVTKDPTGFSDEEWERELADHKVPFVSVEGFPEAPGIASVLMDYRQSVHMALDYLQSRTLAPPVYVAIYTGASPAPNWGDRERLRAYREWTEARGFEARIEWRRDRPWPEAADEWVRWLEAQPKPAAVLANWSRGAVSVYRAAYKLGWRIGEDVRVMAADNTESVNDHLVPALTAVEVPYREMGRAAAARVIDYIEAKRPLEDKEKLWVPARLVPRESV